MSPSSHPLPNIIIFPFMAQGHTLPLLDLAKTLSLRSLSITITIITTPSNAPTISTYTKNHPNIHIKQLSFPQTQHLPKGCENTSQLPSISLLVPFLRATLQLQQPFEDLLQEMTQSGSGSLPVCVISDYFLSWTVVACKKFNLPRLVFQGTGVLAMAITKSVFIHAKDLVIGSDTDPIDIPGVKLPFTLTVQSFPGLSRVPDPSDPFCQFMFQIEQWDKESSGVVVNSFLEMEGEHLLSLESFYKDGSKVWCTGPFLLYDEVAKANPSDELINWLDNQETCKSVIYVSFGSQADESDTQLDEMAYGLEMSTYPFIWVVRSKTWAPPDGLEERIYGKGRIVREWVDQRSILAHRATGGFLSHCGWNSVLESLSMGVPLLAWPMIAEQPLNAMFVVEALEAGLKIPMKHGEIVAVDREVICDVVKELMGSEKGKRLREKAEELGKLARQAVQKGGSSNQNLSELINYLRTQNNESEWRSGSVVGP